LRDVLLCPQEHQRRGPHHVRQARDFEKPIRPVPYTAWLGVRRFEIRQRFLWRSLERALVHAVWLNLLRSRQYLLRLEHVARRAWRTVDDQRLVPGDWLSAVCAPHDALVLAARVRHEDGDLE